MLATTLTILFGILHLIAIVVVLICERRRPSATLAWLLALIFLPGLGLLLYLLFGRLRARREARRTEAALTHLNTVLERYRVEEKLKPDDPARLDATWLNLIRLGDRLAVTPASHGNHAEMLVDGRATYEAMAHAVHAATNHVHACFYIIQPDEAGQRLRGLLTQKAKAGVTVRVLYDGLGSGALPDGFWEPLTDAGGQVAVFRPVNPLTAMLPWSDRFDYRNHRKIVVTDGRVAFTGGINVGKEYLGLDPSIGPWRDAHMRIEGPAALSVQSTFLEDWCYATGDIIDDPAMFPEPRESGNHLVQVIDSGPDSRWPPIYHMFVQAMASARERIWLTTPYFIPDPPVEQALIGAALRGVDVKILIPKRPDHRIVMWAATSYFRPLLEAGAQIYKYEGAFVHAKTLLVDDGIATVGSANMDIRSFHLNYEQNAFVYGEEFAASLATQFETDLAHCAEHTLAMENDLGLGMRLLRSTARILSPLL